jgi:hypothetical protein
MIFGKASAEAAIEIGIGFGEGVRNTGTGVLGKSGEIQPAPVAEGGSNLLDVKEQVAGNELLFAGSQRIW